MTPCASASGEYAALVGWARKQSMISGIGVPPGPGSRVQVIVKTSWSTVCSRTSRAAARSFRSPFGETIFTGRVMVRLDARRPNGLSPSRIREAT
jgi:hypothetical protein